MSDDQATVNESAVSFSEKVTIDALADRPSIPSFDSSLNQWQPETGLRLEGGFTDTKGDDYLETSRPVVVIIGPENNDGVREIAVYYKENGRRETSLDGYYLASDIRHSGGEASPVIREGDEIELPFGKEGNPQRSITPTLEIETIKAGPLA